MTSEFRQRQHGWDKPLTVRHLEIVDELIQAAQNQQDRGTLDQRVTELLDQRIRSRGAWIDSISTRDIHSLHEACSKLEAGPQQELRGNPTQYGRDVLKLKPEGERGIGLGRGVHRQDAWAKFHQVLFNTFRPKTNTRWERPNLSSAELAARKREFDGACENADALARSIVTDLQANDPAAPLLVDHVAQASQFASRVGDQATREDWVSFRARADEGLAESMFLSRSR